MDITRNKFKNLKHRLVYIKVKLFAVFISLIPVVTLGEFFSLDDIFYAIKQLQNFDEYPITESMEEK